jgi:Tfp pilus assembly protein PilO
VKALRGAWAGLGYGLRRLGWPAAVGAGLAVFAAVFWFSGLREAQAQLAQTQAEIVALRDGRTIDRDAERLGVQARLAEFREFFPPAAAVPETLASIHDAAQAHGVLLERAEYKETRDKASPLVRYQVSLPLRGSYPQIRAWLADVMNGNASAVLEDFALKRDEVGSETLEARARLSIYFAGR